jgi:PAS domain S-box-containing protein
LKRQFGPTQTKEEALGRLAAIVESSDDAIIGEALDGRITTWNAAAERLFGYSPSEALGRHISMLIPPGLADDETIIIERIKKGEKVDRYETVRLRKDGRRIELSVTVSPIRDADGTIIGASKIARDITERKRAESELRASEANMAAAQRIAHFGSWERDLTRQDDPTAGPLRWSDEMFRIAGYAPKEVQVTNELFFRLVHPEDREPIRQAVAAAIRDRRQYSIVHRLIRRDGTERTVHETAQIFYDETTGQVTKMVGTAHDITDQRRAEERLRCHQAMLSSAVRIAGLGCWDFDIVQNRLEWSEETFRIFGTTPGAFDGTIAAFLAFVHREDLGAIEGTHARALASGGTVELEYRIIRPDGEERVVCDRGETTCNDAGRPIRRSGVVLDITERKRAEARIQYLRRTHAVLSEINETIVREKDPRKMLIAACRIAVEKGEFRMAWAARLDARTQRVVPVASAGVTEGYLETVELMLRDGARSANPTARALAQGTRAICNDVRRDPDFAPWREEALQQGYLSSALFPLKVGSRTVGAFKLYAAEAGFFDEQGLRLLDQLATDLSIALQLHELETERLRSLEALRASEQRFRELAENIQEVFWATNAAKDQMLYVSPAYEAIWGRTCESLLKSPGDWLEAIHPEDRERVRRAWVSQQAPGGFDVEYRIVRPDGTVRWIHDREFPVRGDAGRVQRFVGVARDITEGRQIAAELERREEWFRSLIENASDLITVVDAQGVVRFQSPSSERILGFSADDLTGRNAFDLMHPDDVGRATDALREARTDGATRAAVEFRFRHRDGGWRTLQSVARVLASQAGERLIVVNSRDITESRKVEDQLRQAQKMEAIGQLAGGVAHDFNNILTATLMHLGLLRQSAQLTMGMKEALIEVEGETMRAANLTRQLLLFSRRQVARFEPLDMNLLITELLKMLRRLLGENVKVEFHRSSAAVWVEADTGMLEQVVMNLCINARDAMPKGGTLTVGTTLVAHDAASMRPHPDARPGRFVCLTVTDTGCGMDESLSKRIFEPFFTTKPAGRGTGLGLATVYGIVKQHKGWVEVESALAKGSAFRVFLPAVAPVDKASVANRTDEVPGGTETILLVEDDHVLRRTAALCLRKLGYAVLAAANVPEALSLWEQHKPRIELLLTDMVMPEEMTGLNLAERFTNEKAALRIIITSGYGAEFSQPHALGKEVAFLAKPYRPTRLARLVRQCLDHR